MKQIIRTYAIGLLTATIAIGFVYWNEDQTPAASKSPALTEAEMIETLENSEFTVLTEQELAEVSSDQTESTQESTKPTPAPTKYAIDITTGTTSSDISQKLEAADIIDNSDDFDRFMKAEDYSRFIQIGQVMLTSDLSFKEIAEAITSK